MGNEDNVFSPNHFIHSAKSKLDKLFNYRVCYYIIINYYLVVAKHFYM